MLVKTDDIGRWIGHGDFDIDSGNFIYFSDFMTIATAQNIILSA